MPKQSNQGSRKNRHKERLRPQPCDHADAQRSEVERISRLQKRSKKNEHQACKRHGQRIIGNPHNTRVESREQGYEKRHGIRCSNIGEDRQSEQKSCGNHEGSQ